MTLVQAELGKKYTVSGIHTDDEELNSFLFTLGCYSGEEITLVSKISGNYVVAIKDGRYNIDQDLAQAILIA
ncbi:MAG: FeoA family protein [Anaerotignum sp.]